MTPRGTWRRVPVTIMRWAEEYGCAMVIYQVVKRHCGCEGHVGLRLDNRESTFGMTPCEAHEAQVHRTMDVLQNMPPSEREIGDLYEEILDAEIGHA